MRRNRAGHPSPVLSGRLRTLGGIEARGDDASKLRMRGVDANGIDAAHPELAGVIAASFDATERPEPPGQHGTGMAGTIAAHARLTGVAPAARILAIRAFAPAGKGDEGTSLAILRSIDWAVANGARVINMSFAGPHDPEQALVLAAAAKKG